MTFVDKVRELFETRKSEVLRMTKVDYTFERRMKLNYDEGRDDGMKLGEKMELHPRGMPFLFMSSSHSFYFYEFTFLHIILFILIKD